MKEKQELFTMVSDQVAESTLSFTQKFIIARILRFQDNGRVFFMTDQTIERKYKIVLNTVRKAITDLKKHSWFQVLNKNQYNQFGCWENTREITIDKEQLESWLEADKLEYEALATAKKLKRDESRRIKKNGLPIEPDSQEPAQAQLKLDVPNQVIEPSQPPQKKRKFEYKSNDYLLFQNQDQVIEGAEYGTLF